MKCSICGRKQTGSYTERPLVTITSISDSRKVEDLACETCLMTLQCALNYNINTMRTKHSGRRARKSKATARELGLEVV